MDRITLERVHSALSALDENYNVQHAKHLVENLLRDSIDLTSRIRVNCCSEFIVESVEILIDHKCVTVWDRPKLTDEMFYGRYVVNQVEEDGLTCFSICDISKPTLEREIAIFKDRTEAQIACAALNLDSVTKNKISYLTASPRGRVVGAIVLMPNLSRAYIDMGHIDWNLHRRDSGSLVNREDPTQKTER